MNELENWGWGIKIAPVPTDKQSPECNESGVII